MRTFLRHSRCDRILRVATSAIRDLVLATALGVAWIAVAHAQAFPSRAVRVIVPFSAGSATDILGRTVGLRLGELWGQPVVVENRAGAGGTIGAAIVAKSPADGHTLLVHSAAHAYNVSIYPTLPFDTLRDFIEVAPLAGQPNVLVVSPATGLRSVADLVTAAREKPGQFDFGSAGIGSGTHINAEKFRLAARIDVVHVPYKGTPEALADTLAGRLTFFFSPISAALPQIREGKVLALGVSTAKRSSALPDVPTIAESGLPGFDYNLWIGLFAPAGTPVEVVERINRDVARVVGMPEVRDRLASLGAEPMAMSATEFRTFVHAEIEESSKVIRAAGIKAQ